jgi:4-amino-4-deoxy-L-arabinose transferase-like glycosyltransferase
MRRGSSGQLSIVLALIVVVYLILAVACARTLIPWCDEAWFSGPAYNLITHGYMGTPVLDPTAGWFIRDLTRIDRYTYWMVPLYPLSQALWFQFFHFGLMTVRLYSVFWGLVALAAWFLVVKRITGDTRIGLLTAALLATDFTFLWGAGVGRMDMMCEALELGGIAAFLWLREKNLFWAILAGHAGVAAAGLAHPMALGACAGLIALTLYYDRRRIRIAHVAVAAVPYLTGALAWGAYIAKDPALFWSQFSTNVGNRVISGPMFHWLKLQIVDRYFYMFGLAPDTLGLSHLKIVVLAIYATGLAGVLLNRQIRNDERFRPLLLLWLVSMFMMAFVDKEVHSFYLLHFVNPLAAILAVWLCWNWDTRTVPRWALVSLVAISVLVQFAVLGSRIRQNRYRDSFLAATEYLKQHTGPDDRIFGSAELAFELGFEGQVVDDFRLGYRTGKKAQFVVLDQNRYQEWIPNLEQTEPAAYSYITNLLDHEFKLAYQNTAYKIYLRNMAAAGGVSP